MADQHEVEPHLFVVFGGTGDLMSRKLLPALYRLSKQGRLGKSQILGVGRRADINDDQFRDWARDALAEMKESNDAGTWCDKCLFYQPIREGKLPDYQALAGRIEDLERTSQLPGNRVFYLALPPSVFPDTIRGLGESGLNRSPGWTRLVIEKPFGHDLLSAEALNQLVHRYFDESQLYRIDHYLGKETVQNLLVFRFANTLFESAWNRDRIESVQITVAEDLGLEERAGYYDTTGALRDMVQNHLTQLLTLTAMEVPGTFEAQAIRYEKIKVLHALMPSSAKDAIFGQYAEGELNHRKIQGYLQEPGVDPHSQTETFVALRLWVANWRWQGVPFYLRTGKRLARQVTQIVVQFRCPPVSLFQPHHRCQIHSNSLIVTLQPNEGFDLCFEVKSPGQEITLQTQRLHFRYADAFGRLPDAYETLLLDILTGDQTLFVHADEVETAWRIYTPLLETKREVHPYRAGSWGPAQSDELLAQDGQAWMIL